MSALTSRDILLAAADHCDEVGLHRGGYWPTHVPATALEEDTGEYVPGDPCCALGHLRVAAGQRAPQWLEGWPSREASRAFSEAAEALRVHLGLAGGVAIARWSDDPTRTASDVSSALRAAAGGAR